MTSKLFEQYRLPYTPFDYEMHDTMMHRVSGADFVDEYRALTSQAPNVFLSRPLTPDELHEVNSKETLRGAREAEAFRDSLMTIRVEEGYEPMVHLRIMPECAALGWTFSEAPYHQACGEWAGKERLMWVRQGLGRRIVDMSTHLASAEYGLHFEDTYRPTGVQEGLFARRIAMARAAHPEWTDDECLLEAQSKTAYTPRFAAHKAGAAADVRVRDLRSGDLLDIGHNYPDGGETVRLDSPFVTQAQWQYRKVLQAAALKARLTMYPYEDWHVCMNDVTAAAVAEDFDGTVTYGPIKRFDTETGAISEVYNTDELDQTFHIS